MTNKFTSILLTIALTLLFVAPVTAEENHTLKEDKGVATLLCIFFECDPPLAETSAITSSKAE